MQLTVRLFVTTVGGDYMEEKMKEKIIAEIKNVPGLKENELVILRKFDCDDIIAIRNDGFETKIIDGKEVVSAKMGEIVKSHIIHGIKSAPFFSKTVTEERGVQPALSTRLTEFRKIPVDALDFLFSKVKDYNPSKDNETFRKK